MSFDVFYLGKKLITMIKNSENYDNWIEYVDDRPFNDERYYISNDKLKIIRRAIQVGELIWQFFLMALGIIFIDFPGKFPEKITNLLTFPGNLPGNHSFIHFFQETSREIVNVSICSKYTKSFYFKTT